MSCLNWLGVLLGVPITNWMEPHRMELDRMDRIVTQTFVENILSIENNWYG